MKERNFDETALRERLVTIVTGVLGDGFQPESRRLEMTSLQMLELIVALEDEFDIHISEDAPLIRITSSVDSILQYLRTALDAAQSPRSK